MTYRTEQDSLGRVDVPESALYGAQTQRALDNFKISGQLMPAAFIQALAQIKYACAWANQTCGKLDNIRARALMDAAAQIAQGQHPEHFPVDIYQTGSGTSTNMNMNEVLTNIARHFCEEDLNPNDHANMGQSSNDVIPSALQLSAAIQIQEQLLPALTLLEQALEKRANELEGLVKTGRTHLMDALPLEVSQELSGWRSQLQLAREGLEFAANRLGQLPLGGTAIGTGINTHADFAKLACDQLSQQTGIDCTPSRHPFAAQSGLELAVSLSGQLKTCANALLKISNDIRWLSSGPLCGLAEIQLPALQPGSSIMPGKVNPVIPEAVMMAAMKVCGNDTTVTLCGQHGNFQLNTCLPLAASCLLESIQLLSNASKTLADKCIEGFTVNRERLDVQLARNPILATALNPEIGYEKAAQIAKQAYSQGRPVLDVAAEVCELDRERLEELLDPRHMTRPHSR